MLLTTSFTRPAVWVPKAPNLWLEIAPGSDLGAFVWSSKGFTLIVASLPYALVLDTQKGCSAITCIL